MTHRELAREIAREVGWSEEKIAAHFLRADKAIGHPEALAVANEQIPEDELEVWRARIRELATTGHNAWIEERAARARAHLEQISKTN